MGVNFDRNLWLSAANFSPPKTSIMKKVLFGILAIVAVAATAFMKKSEAPSAKKQQAAPSVKAEEPEQTCVWFTFSGTPFNQASVENPANWLENSNAPNLCDNVNRKACAACVKLTAIQGTAPNRTLKPTANLDAGFYMPGGGSWYIVPSGTSDVPMAKNRS